MENISAMIILDFIIKGSIISIIWFLIAKLFRAASPSIRSSLWNTTFLSILIIPFLTYMVPEYNLELIPSNNFNETQLFEDKSPINQEKYSSLSEAPVLEDGEKIIPKKNIENKVNESKNDAVSEFLLSFSFGEWIFIIWLTTAIIIYFKLFLGLLSIWWLAKRSKFIMNKEWNLLSIELSNTMGLKRNVKLILSERTVSPMTWGIFQPFVLLPKTAENWSSERLKAVLIHEFAHVKRNDFTIHLFIQLCCSIFWFNPIIWNMSREMVSDREKACDDHVIYYGTKGSEYATHLLDIAKGLNKNFSMLATVCMARPSQLEGRLMSILQNNAKNINNKFKYGIHVASFLIILPVSSINPWYVNNEANFSEEEKLVATVDKIESAETLDKEDEVDDIKKISADKLENNVPKELNKKKLNMEELQSNVKGNITVEDGVVSIENGLVTMEINDDGELDVLLDMKAVDELVSNAEIEALNDVVSDAESKAEKMSKNWKETKSHKSTHLDADGNLDFRMSSSKNWDKKSNKHKSSLVPELSDNPKDSLTLDDILRMKRYGVTVEYIIGLKKLGFKNLTVDEVVTMKRYNASLAYISKMKDYGNEKLTADDIAMMSRYGVSTKFIDELSSVGLKDIPVESLTDMARFGVSTKLIKELKESGFEFSYEDIIDASRYGVSSSYIKSLSELGYKDLDLEDISDMSRYGVTISYIEKLSDIGYKNLDAEMLTDFARYGVSTELIAEIKDSGFKADHESIVDAARYGVSSRFMKSLIDAGYKDLSLEEVIEMGKYGVSSSYINKLNEYGLKRLDPGTLTDFAKYGVSTKFLKSLKDAGFENANYNDIIDAAKHGISSKYMKQIVNLGFNNLSLEDIIDMGKYGVSANLIETLKNSGYKTLDVDDIIDFAKHGVSANYIQDLKKLGFKNIPAKDLINARRHGVSANYIKRFQSKGIKDLTLNDYIKMRRYNLEPEYIKKMKSEY